VELSEHIDGHWSVLDPPKIVHGPQIP